MVAGNIPGRDGDLPLAIYDRGAGRRERARRSLLAGRAVGAVAAACSWLSAGSAAGAAEPRCRLDVAPHKAARRASTSTWRGTRGRRRRGALRALRRRQDPDAPVPGRADAAGCRPHRRGRRGALRLRRRAWTSRRSAAASATSSRATRSSRISPWPRISASGFAAARARSGGRARRGARAPRARGASAPRARASSRAASGSGWPSAERSRSDPGLLLLDEPLSALDVPLRRALRDDLAPSCASGASPRWSSPTTSRRPTGSPTASWSTRRARDPVRAARGAPLAAGLASGGAASWVCATCSRAPCSRPRPIASSSAGAARSWKPSTRPRHSYLPAPDTPLAFFIRPEYVRLIRKDRGPADPDAPHEPHARPIVREADFGTTWTLLHPPRRAGRARAGGFRPRGGGAAPRLRDPRDRARSALGVLHPSRLHSRVAVGMATRRAGHRARRRARGPWARAVLDVPALDGARGRGRSASSGPNGSGKSTLLRVLGLLEPPPRARCAFTARR